MITKFNNFLNESLRDLMTGIPDEEIRGNLKGLSINSQFEFIKNNGLPEKFYPVSVEKLSKKYNKIKKLKDKKRYIDSEFVPSEVYKDDKELIEYLDDNIFTSIQGTRDIRNMEPISDEEIKRDINNTLLENDLNEALLIIQDLIGQKYGDTAASYFSHYDDVDNYWSNLSYIDRKILLEPYLMYEEIEEIEEDDK